MDSRTPASPKAEDYLWVVEESVACVLRSGKVPHHIPRDDLLSAGYLAMVLATHKYPLCREPRLNWVAYCRVWVRRAIVREAMFLNGQRRTDSHHGGGEIIECVPPTYLPDHVLRKIEEDAAAR